MLLKLPLLWWLPLLLRWRLPLLLRWRLPLLLQRGWRAAALPAARAPVVVAPLLPLHHTLNLGLTGQYPDPGCPRSHTPWLTHQYAQQASAPLGSPEQGTPDKNDRISLPRGSCLSVL
jgi:hypothetical protein